MGTCFDCFITGMGTALIVLLQVWVLL